MFWRNMKVCSKEDMGIGPEIMFQSNGNRMYCHSMGRLIQFLSSNLKWPRMNYTVSAKFSTQGTKREGCQELPLGFPCFWSTQERYWLVIDFRKLNTMLVWPEYPLPTIDGLIQSIIGFSFVTGLDLIMDYLSVSLHEPSKVILTIICHLDFFNAKHYCKELSQPHISFKAWWLLYLATLRWMHPRSIWMMCCIPVAIVSIVIWSI